MRLTSLFIAVALTVSPNAHAQDVPTKGLQPMRGHLQNNSLGLGAKWTLVSMGSEVTKSGQDAINDPGKYLQRTPTNDFQRLQIALLSPHLGAITDALDKLKFNNFLYLGDELPPIYIVEHNGALTLLLAAISSETVYNTLNSTARSRASQVASSLVLPALKDLSRALSIPNLKFCGVMAVYGSKDFLNRSSVLNLKSEALSIVASVDLLRKYAENDLADDDLVAAADIYVVDGDDPGLKKIRLTFQ